MLTCRSSSSVTRLFAWRMISCVSFTGAPTSISNVASDRRNVRQPMRFVIPACFAAGRDNFSQSRASRSMAAAPTGCPTSAISTISDCFDERTESRTHKIGQRGSAGTGQLKTNGRGYQGKELRFVLSAKLSRMSGATRRLYKPAYEPCTHSHLTLVDAVECARENQSPTLDVVAIQNGRVSSLNEVEREIFRVASTGYDKTEREIVDKENRKSVSNLIYMPPTKLPIKPYKNQYKCPYGRNMCGENSSYCESCDRRYEHFLSIRGDH
jgi:hypothetical protein